MQQQQRHGNCKRTIVADEADFSEASAYCRPRIVQGIVGDGLYEVLLAKDCMQDCQAYIIQNNQVKSLEDNKSKMTH